MYVCRRLYDLACEQIYRTALVTLDIKSTHKNRTAGLDLKPCDLKFALCGKEPRDGPCSCHPDQPRALEYPICRARCNLARIRKFHLRIPEPSYDYELLPHGFGYVPWPHYQRLIKELVVLLNYACLEFELVYVQLLYRGSWRQSKVPHTRWMDEELQWDLDTVLTHLGDEATKEDVNPNDPREYFLAHQRGKYLAWEELRGLRGVQAARVEGCLPAQYAADLEQAMTRLTKEGEPKRPQPKIECRRRNKSISTSCGHGLAV